MKGSTCGDNLLDLVSVDSAACYTTSVKANIETSDLSSVEIIFKKPPVLDEPYQQWLWDYKKAMEVMKAPNSVGHMMTGKAIARAVWAHLKVDAALNALSISDVLEVPLLQQLQDADDMESQARGFTKVTTAQHQQSSKRLQ